MQLNITNPAKLVASIAANFGALEPITIFHSPAGFLVVNTKDANPDTSKGEKVVFNGYCAEFSDYRFDKMMQAHNIPAGPAPVRYAIMRTEYDESRLPVAPGRVVCADLFNLAAAENALTTFYNHVSVTYNNNFTTKPGFWTFNVLRSKAPGDRTWINYRIIEVS